MNLKVMKDGLQIGDRKLEKGEHIDSSEMDPASVEHYLQSGGLTELRTRVVEKKEEEKS